MNDRCRCSKVPPLWYGLLHPGMVLSEHICIGLRWASVHDMGGQMGDGDLGLTHLRKVCTGGPWSITMNAMKHVDGYVMVNVQEP